MTGAFRHSSPQVDRPSVQRGREHVAGLDDADDIVDRAVSHGNAAVRRVRASAAAISSRRRVNIDPVDFGSRSHDLADRPVGQADDAGNDRAFVFLENAGSLRFGDDQVQLFGGHRGSSIPRSSPSSLKIERTRPVEQPDERRGALSTASSSAAPSRPRSARASAARSAWARSRR